MNETSMSDIRAEDDDGAEILNCDISDAALEAAAGIDTQGQVTERFTAFGVDNCLMC